jgi:acid phosphatase (class A)
MRVLLLLVLFSCTAFAQELYYLNKDSVDLTLVPIPPVENSVEDLADLEEVYNVQQKRTEADCKKSLLEESGLSTAFFGSAYGPLTDAEAEKLLAFQERLFNETKYFYKTLKDEHARLRPFNRDTRITPCIRRNTSLSYPSGHSTIAHLAARSFAMIYPEFEVQFLARAEEIAWGRVVGGVHHPLDTIAGKVLGILIFEELKKNQQFMTDLENLKK